MKGKGLIQFFAVALILVCVYQLSFNFITRRVENRAAETASVSELGSKTLDEVLNSNISQSAKDSLTALYKKENQKYLDSVSNETVYNLGIGKFTYQECKSQELALGLDLQGGMNVVLQVSLEDLVRSLSDYSTDPVFNQAITDAGKLQTVNSNKDFVTLFGEAYDKLAPNGHLAAIFATRGNLDKITPSSTNAEVLAFIKKEADGAFTLVTEIAGEDGNDQKKAILRHTYSLNSNTFSVVKDVKFEGTYKWIKRNEYLLNREKN